MKNSTIRGFLVALPLLLAATGESLAWTESFSGTQGQVRMACAEVGGYLLDAPNHTICFHDAEGTSVTCTVDLRCGAVGPGLGPIAIGTDLGLRNQQLSTGSVDLPAVPGGPG